MVLKIELRVGGRVQTLDVVSAVHAADVLEALAFNVPQDGEIQERRVGDVTLRVISAPFHREGRAA